MRSAQVVLVHTTTAYRTGAVPLHSLLILASAGSKQSASGPTHSTPVAAVHSTHWTGGWLGLQIKSVHFAEQKNLLSVAKFLSFCPAQHFTIILTTLPWPLLVLVAVNISITVNGHLRCDTVPEWTLTYRVHTDPHLYAQRPQNDSWLVHSHQVPVKPGTAITFSLNQQIKTKNNSLILVRVTVIMKEKLIRKCIQTITTVTQSFPFVQSDPVLTLCLFVLHPLLIYITS
jgi:hypothetical protein